MPDRQRSRAAAVLTGRQRAAEKATRLGTRIREARRRRGWSQRVLGEKVGVNGRRVGQLERGRGAGAPLHLLYAAAAALDVPLNVDLSRDRLADATDAGHLGIQELMLRLGRLTGRQRTFELPTRPADPALSVDVGQRDDQRRLLLLLECWNTFGSINASVRSTRRKMAEAEALALAAAIAGDRPPYRIAGCWVVRDTRRNREIVARYPGVFADTFTGSSVGWVRALTQGDEPPSGLGIAWCDLAARRIFAWRHTGR